MDTQNYRNHLRFYPMHHFVFYPVVLILLISSIYYALTDLPNQKIWIFSSALIFIIGWLAFMLRQHYALVLQNRIVRQELRYRYYVITATRFEAMENLLNDSQLFALRFASDAELPNLTQKALAENMTGDEIKKSIVNWRIDHHRV